MFFSPKDIMNREKESQLPMMQVNFIDSICLPIYEVNLHILHSFSLYLSVFFLIDIQFS